MCRNGNILTDSGGFQMVSLLKLAVITDSWLAQSGAAERSLRMGQEDGVEFEDPKKPGSRMLLTPEKSIESQNDIGADIMTALGFAQFQASKQCPSEFSRMALDDVATRPVV